jgi:hypothetical protein
MLVGALAAVGVCGFAKARKQRPSFWPALSVALLLEMFASLMAWRENGHLDLEERLYLVLLGFAFFGVAGFLPAAIVVALYRSSGPNEQHRAESGPREG